MTSEQIKSMPAGPEMDRLIAELMGVELDYTHARLRKAAAGSTAANDGRGVYVRCSGCGLNGFANHLDLSASCPAPECDPYSSEMEFAWQVVEKIRAKFDAVSLVQRAADYYVVTTPLRGGISFCPTAPLAICQAALMALETKGGGE